MNKIIWNSNVKVRLIGEGLFNLLFWMYFPFLTVYFGQRLGLQTAGLIMALPPLLSIVGSLMGGSFADTLGRRPVMLIGTFMQMSMFILFAVSSSPWIDYVAFIGIGIGAAFYRPASSAMVADTVPKDELRQVYATFMTVNNIGAVLGPVIGAVFFFQYRQLLLWTCAIVLLLYFILIYFIVNETLPVRSKQKDVTTPLKYAFQSRWSGYQLILKDRIFLLYVIAGIFSLFPVMQLDLYLPVYVVENVPKQPLIPHLMDSYQLTSQSIFGWLVGFNGLLFVVLILPVTNRLKHWTEKRLFIISTLLAGGGTFLIVWNSSIWFLFGCTLIFTLGEIMRTPVTQSFIGHYAPEEARGQYLAADSLQNTLGKSLAPLAIYMSGWIEPLGIFTIILLFSLVGVCLYLQLFRLYSPVQHQVEK
ncbi:MFS transporter [Exiguobacterium sp. A1_3_1]|uniref:MDR family MFS transporter n=1 Tax=Exiguobacterium sp. A1_3_1 TaxID=2651871 RepID=UPI003B86FC7A